MEILVALCILLTIVEVGVLLYRIPKMVELFQHSSAREIAIGAAVAAAILYVMHRIGRA